MKAIIRNMKQTKQFKIKNLNKQHVSFSHYDLKNSDNKDVNQLTGGHVTSRMPAGVLPVHLLSVWYCREL